MLELGAGLKVVRDAKGAVVGMDAGGETYTRD
jgi:hypothetical protein